MDLDLCEGGWESSSFFSALPPHSVLPLFSLLPSLLFSLHQIGQEEEKCMSGWVGGQYFEHRRYLGTVLKCKLLTV